MIMPYSDLHQIINERLRREGPISFAEYMRMALYEPGYGYYMTGAAKMGWEADYFTSTDVSSLFANCMGRQLFAMWEKLKRPGHFIVLEQGAGREHLAEGVRLWAQKEASEFYEVLDYRTEDIRGGEDATASDEFDQSKTVRYSTQYETGNITSRYPTQGDPRVPTPHNTTPAPTRGARSLEWETPSVVLSNELIDAFPVHI